MEPRIEVDTKRTIRNLSQWKEDVSKEKQKAFEDITEGVLRRASPNVPVKTGKLKASLKARVGKTTANVRIGTPKGVPYADPVHWGRKAPQDPADWFLFREVHPGAQPFPQPAGPFADWIEKRAHEAMDASYDRLSRRLQKVVSA